jgi:hypothetical protein
MLPRTVQCPQCGSSFLTPRSPGMQVHCPQCLSYFAVPIAAAPLPEAVAAPSLPVAPVTQEVPPPVPEPQNTTPAIAALPGMHAVETARPKPAPKAKRAKAAVVAADDDESPQGDSWGGILLISTMLLAILGGGGYWLYGFIQNRPHPEVEIAQTGDPVNPIAPALNSEPKAAPATSDSGTKSPPDQGSPSSNPPNPPITPQPNTEPPKVRPIEKEDPGAFFKPVALGGSETRTWSVPGLEPHRIEKAIERGVEHLRRTQNASGTWKQNHGVGYAALGGLVLLECKVLPSDPAVQSAARYVRQHSEKLNATYELSLAVLFLDRLADSRDRPLIQTLALRLIAGQTEQGGWTYTCPVLGREDAVPLLTLLQRTKPNIPTIDPLAGPGGNYPDPLAQGKPTTQIPLASDPKGDLPIPLQGFGPDRFPIPRASTDDPKEKDDPRLIVPTTPNEPKKEMPETPKETKPEVAKKPLLRPKTAPLRPEAIPPGLRNVPAIAKQWEKKGKGKRAGSHDDNSNTQFALLALWAARRHGVPTEQALLIADERFAGSQNVDGGWGYHLHGGSSPSMTCVGLLGLAMGHGAKGTALKPGTAPSAENPAIQAGLRKLGSHLGEPVLSPQSGLRMENLYVLWSLERVAMLYNLKTVGGKDWYGWGAQILVVNQSQDGSWAHSANFAGSEPIVNTCFALLFLKRSNLVQDLSENLRLNLAITDPDLPNK